MSKSFIFLLNSTFLWTNEINKSVIDKICTKQEKQENEKYVFAMSPSQDGKQVLDFPWFVYYDGIFLKM